MNTHDYTERYWGHDYTFRPIEGGLRGRASGWGHGIKEGDYILLQNGSGSSRYKVDSITYYTDPPDMWVADLSFAPRIREGQVESVRGRG